MRNPPWTRDELILALELYFKEPSARGSKSHPAVIELSELLNQLPIRPRAEEGTTYRNPNGVGLKLSNFLQFDPSYTGSGMAHGGKLDSEVWEDFSGDLERLYQIADAIRANVGDALPGEMEEPPGDDEDASEGRILTRVHNRRERNQGLVKKKKAKVLAETGKLACEVCGFDFADVYGEIGEGFAECHHTRPVSTLKPDEKTKLSDLVLVCANCHRMLHRAKPWISVGQLTKLIGSVDIRSSV